MVNYMNERIKKLVYLLLLIIIFYLLALLFPKLVIVLKFISSIIVPFLISFSIAFALNPVVTYINKFAKKRWISVTAVVIIICLLFFLLGRYSIPLVTTELSKFVMSLPDIIGQIESFVSNLIEKYQFLKDYVSIESITQMLNDSLKGINDIPKKIIDSINKYLDIIIFIPIITIYFLLDYEKIMVKFREYLLCKGYDRLKDCLGEINKTMLSFLKGYILVLVILSITTFIALSILRVEFAALFGIIIGITDIIPFVGPYIGGAFPVIYVLIEDQKKMIYVLISIVLIQLLESNFISPYVQAKQTKNHPLVVILSLIIFGKIFGLIGMIIAVPVLSIIRIIWKYYHTIWITNLKRFLGGSKG